MAGWGLSFSEASNTQFCALFCHVEGVVLHGGKVQNLLIRPTECLISNDLSYKLIYFWSTFMPTSVSTNPYKASPVRILVRIWFLLERVTSALMIFSAGKLRRSENDY